MITSKLSHSNPNLDDVLHEGNRHLAMRKKTITNEQRYFDALKRIAKGYMTPERLYKTAHNVGCLPEEHIEYAYENIINEAKNAIRGKRRPK